MRGEKAQTWFGTASQVVKSVLLDWKLDDNADETGHVYHNEVCAITFAYVEQALRKSHELLPDIRVSASIFFSTAQPLLVASY